MSDLHATPKYLQQKSDGDSLSISTSRFSILALAIAYTLFVIYGSLVPLNFKPYSLREAFEAFSNIRYLDLKIGNRADWVANILLFVPLAFVWLGTLWHSKSIFWRSVATLFVLLACTGLSVVIEFTQIFFPPRTVSLNDIYAEALGTFIGVSLWWAIGSSVTRWYLSWRTAEGPKDLAQRLLYGYLFLLFGYSLLPLDLTISPVEIYHKWHAGRIALIPFTFTNGQDEPAQRLYGFIIDVLIWVPAGMLARFTAKRNGRQIWLSLTAVAALIEFLQIFVYTRVTDTSAILTASLGSAVGVWLAIRWRTKEPAAEQAKAASNAGGLIAGLLLWLALIFAVFWYPFDFRADRAFVGVRLAEATTRVPFALYYFGTEYRAATEVLHKMGFFFPLGILLALFMGRFCFGSPFLWKMAALAGVGIVAGSVEAGQLFLPGKFADLTDWVLEMAGGWAGCALAWRTLSMRHIQVAPAISAPQHSPWLFAGGLVLGYALLLLAITHIPAVPYNVRELIAEGYPVFSALALACSIAWIFGFPAWAAIHMVTGSRRPTYLLPFLLLHGIVAWILLRVAVPLESIHDIVGSPILGWPWEWELIGRFICLFALWTVVSFGAGFLTLRSWLPKAGSFLWVWAAVALALLPVVNVVVIQQAATDNLTELLAGGGTPMAFLWLTAGLFMIALAGAQLACALGSGMRVGVMRGALWSVASFPLTYLALHAGFEPYIIKYGQVFSAFQFLLSQDRAHYAASTDLLLRYGFAHGILLFTIAASQAPFLGNFILLHTIKTRRPVS
jgi:VanZ family protein